MFCDQPKLLTNFVTLPKVTRTLLGHPFTACTESDFNHFDNPEIYNAKKCQYKTLYQKIFKKCNCTLKYVDDIHHFFDKDAEEDLRRSSSCSVLQHA